MLSCVSSSKQLVPSPDDDVVVAGVGTPRSRQDIKALITTQIKVMALKASGAYRQCKPCSGAVVVERRRDYMESEASVSGNRTPPSMSGQTEEAASVFMEEEEGGEREWISQVEPGVLITFVSVAGGGNDLKRIRFSREKFNKWQAQRWWAENHEKVLELYNVQGTNHPPPTLPGSEVEVRMAESSKKEIVNPMTPPLNEERAVMGSSSSSESQEQHQEHSRDSPVLSSNSGGKTGILRKSSSSSSSSNMEKEEEEEEEEEEEKDEVEGSGGETSVSTSNDSSDQEREWVQQDEPGVYLTIRARPGGVRELRRVRFSRERFGEMLARMWWEENRDRIHQQYLFKVN